MDATTSRLVDFAADLSFSSLPPHVVQGCKTRIIDTLGCMTGAYHAPLSVAARGLAGRSSGTEGARVIGARGRSSMELAAFANGVMLRYLDLSDMYRIKSGGHPSDVIAAVLAVADATHASGAALIGAVTLAYEVYCSFCDSVEINSQGWDQPVYGVIASALGAATLMNLGRQEMADAVSLAIVPNMALYQTRRGALSSWKNCAGANASRNGVFAAVLAREGFTGPGESFEGRAGLKNIIGAFDWQIPTAGAELAVTRTHLKRYPACYHGQTAIECAIALHDKLEGRRIASVEVDTFRMAYDKMASDPTRWAPENHPTADHSLPYVVAVALTDGELTDESFADARLRDPALLALMQRTHIRENPDLTARCPQLAPCRLTVRLDDGKSVDVAKDYPRGHAESPLGNDEVDAKFHSLFRGFGPAAQADDILRSLWQIETAPDVGVVVEMFARDA